ncbi:MAG: hypothetical protein HQK93_07230 [Nitrospirae bacterium]|nr:hypothetical protein [Nitrospirota bacterium]
MIILPVKQTTVGQGNTILSREQVIDADTRHIQVCFQNANGMPYSGSNTLTVSIYASLEPALSPSDIWFPFLLTSIVLNKTTPTAIYDMSGYRNIILVVNGITDGMTTAYIYPQQADYSKAV